MSIEKELLTSVHSILSTDEVLLSMLAANYPMGKTSGQKDPIYSILPRSLANTRTKPPFIVLEIVQTDRHDFRYSSVSYTVSVYLEQSSTTVKGYEILERVRTLLDEANLGISGFVRNSYETQIETMESEPLSMLYTTATYRAQFVR